MIVSLETRLRSEIDSVQRMLAELPKEFAIDRMSLESRIESLEEQLREFSNHPEPGTENRVRARR